MATLTRRISEEEYAHDMAAKDDQRRLLYVAVPIAVFILGLGIKNGWVDFLGVALFFAGIAIYKAPRDRVKQFDAARARWEDLLRRSLPCQDRVVPLM